MGNPIFVEEPMLSTGLRFAPGSTADDTCLGNLSAKTLPPVMGFMLEHRLGEGCVKRDLFG